MILEFLASFFLCAFILFTAIVAHEWGHAYWYRKITGKTAKVNISLRNLSIGSKADFKGLSDEEYKEIIWAGIIIGAAQLVLAIGVLGVPGPVTLILITLYIYGSKGDIRKLRSLNGG